MNRRIKTSLSSLAVIGILASLILASIPTPSRIAMALPPPGRGGNGGGNGGGSSGGSVGAYVNGEVVCQVKSGVSATAVARRHKMTVLKDLEDNIFLFGLSNKTTVTQAVTELKADPDVALAEPNYVLSVPEVSGRGRQRGSGNVDGDPSVYYGQYALQLIRATEAQAIATGSGVTVAVIDTGVDTSHPAFQQVAPGYDYVDNDRNPSETGSGPAYGHGTMVAGVVVLVAPQAAIMPLRAFSSDGLGKASDVSRAIRDAVRSGADVINMSFGLPGTSAPIQAAINFAARHGVLMIASAGNDNTDVPQFPASDNAHVLAVAATDSADVKAEFSNYGSYIDVCAPGVSIYSAYPGGLYTSWDGTSFAAPFVSGEAALVLSAGTGGTTQIKTTAVNIDTLNASYRGLLGTGRIEALAAVNR